MFKRFEKVVRGGKNGVKWGKNGVKRLVQSPQLHTTVIPLQKDFNNYFSYIGKIPSDLYLHVQ